VSSGGSFGSKKFEAVGVSVVKTEIDSEMEECENPVSFNLS
jgi:hypothetical protein